MAKFLSNIDLNGNELQNAVIQPLGTEPSTPKVGRKYFDTSKGREEIYDGTTWKVSAYLSDLESLSSDNEELANTLSQLRTDFDALNKALTEDDTQGIINTWNEIVALVDGLPEDSDLATIIANINAEVKDLQDELSELKNSATKVSFTQTITSGKEVGKISIDGTETEVYAPANYSWEEISGKTASKLIALLGFTPFDAESFTKANIKAELGIADWALSATPPTYSAVDVGATRKYFQVLHAGEKSYNVTHAFNTTDVTVSIYDTAHNQVFTDVNVMNNYVVVSFAETTTEDYRVVVIG